MSILENLHAWCTQLLLLRKLMVIKLLKYWRQGRICWSVIGIETTGTFLAIAVEQMGEGNWFQLYIVSCETLLLLLPKQDLPFFFSVGIWRWNIIFSCLSFVSTYLNWKLCNRNTFIIVNLYFSVIFRTGCQYTCQVKISSWYKLTSFKLSNIKFGLYLWKCVFH